MGGLLVLGTNQVIHVDQAARCTAVGVNVYAKMASNFAMTHRPDLTLALEGAVPVPLGNEEGDVVLALRNSKFVKLRFLRDGRNVTDIDIEMLEISSLPEVGLAGFSCAVPLESHRAFLGSTTGDSILMGYSPGDKARDSSGVVGGMNDTVDDLEALYGDDRDEIEDSKERKGTLRLQVHNFLMNVAPIRDATFAPPAFTDVCTLYPAPSNSRTQNSNNKVS